MKAKILHAGSVAAVTLYLEASLSFWGGFDQATGMIIDQYHPQCGKSISGKIILMAESKGSGTASGALAEALRRGIGPAAIVLVKPDVNLAIGAAVAEQLYGAICPVLTVTAKDLSTLQNIRHLHITIDGEIRAQTS
jgi:uncharacterized protein